jgi:hypothetical protein
MKCFCCKDGNLINFQCNECQNPICFKCINKLVKDDIDIKDIKICNFCITAPVYKNYINLETTHQKRDLEKGLLTKCKYCLNIWDGFAQCDCNERYKYEYEIIQQNKNKESNIYKDFFSNLINFDLYQKDTVIDVNPDSSVCEMV